MVSDMEEKYSLGKGVLRYLILDTIYEFHKTHKQYPARVILNPEHSSIEGTFFVPFEMKLAPSIKHLENEDIETSEARGYYVDIQFDEIVDEKSLICRGFAKTS